MGTTSHKMARIIQIIVFHFQGLPLDVRDALHAGPVLISDGRIDLNIEDEVFVPVRCSARLQLVIQKINI